MKALHDVGSLYFATCSTVESRVVIYETTKTILAALLPSALTLMLEWQGIRDAVGGFDAALMRQLHQIRPPITSTTDQLYNTEGLHDQMAGTISSLSANIASVQGSIKSNKGCMPHTIGDYQWSCYSIYTRTA